MQAASLPDPSVHPGFAALTSEAIDINEDACVRYWMAALGCNEFDLRVAVAKVGTGVKEVGTVLGCVV